MLTIVTWLWGNKYSAEDVRKLRAGFRRHLKQAHRFVCCTDRGETFGPDIITAPIWDMDLTESGCLARLRMFDPEWQGAVAPGSTRIVCSDLDAVVTGPVDPLFDRSDDFCITQKMHSANPCPYNGSLWMLRASFRPDVWSGFSIEAAEKVPHWQIVEDQAWIAHKLPGAKAWVAGAEHQVYGFQKIGWPGGEELPAGARFVAFPGARSPAKFAHVPWVKEHWSE